MNEWMVVWMDRWWMNGPMDWWRDGWMNEWMDTVLGSSMVPITTFDNDYMYHVSTSLHQIWHLIHKLSAYLSISPSISYVYTTNLWFILINPHRGAESSNKTHFSENERREHCLHQPTGGRISTTSIPMV